MILLGQGRRVRRQIWAHTWGTSTFSDRVEGKVTLVKVELKLCRRVWDEPRESSVVETSYVGQYFTYVSNKSGKISADQCPLDSIMGITGDLNEVCFGLWDPKSGWIELKSEWEMRKWRKRKQAMPSRSLILKEKKKKKTIYIYKACAGRRCREKGSCLLYFVLNGRTIKHISTPREKIW